MPNDTKFIWNYSTNELVDELLKRKGVEQMTVAPHSNYEINIDENWNGDKDFTTDTGCARILIVTD